MNAAEVIKRLRRERSDWDEPGQGAEASWTVRGINIALRVVRELAQEERGRMIERRPRLARWLAGDLYRAACQALALLKRGERAKAIEILEKIVALVKEGAQRRSQQQG